MSSQQFQETYAQVSDLSHRLLKFLKEYREGKLLEGDKTENLQSVEERIQSAIDGLAQQKYEVAVVAPMKAGKSTFLNAIIGADILASESAACTICRTDIQHLATEELPCLLEYYEGSNKPLVIAEGSADEIQQQFLSRTRQLRSDKKIDEEMPNRFELRYPIEAISGLPALSGFTLIDTPGPNEWKSMSVDTVALKQVSLEALRTCKAVLFILNYRSFKDKAVDELFQSITENRKELLKNNKSRVFFILNQIDLKSEKDPEISETVSLLEKELTGFGFPDPIVYPVSALQGLLAKLIQQSTASEKQVKDFENFFSGRYTVINERGRKEQLLPHEAAPQAIQDSGIIAVQDAIFQTIVQTSGWNLLSDALDVIDGAAKSLENTLNTIISGWEMEVSTLKIKVEEYNYKASLSREKVKSVGKSIDKQKELLLDGFRTVIDGFTEGAKDKLEKEIELIAESRRSEKIAKKNTPVIPETRQSTENDFFQNLFFNIANRVIESIPFVGQELSKLFKFSSSLMDGLRESVPQVFQPDPDQSKEPFNPYVIRCATRRDAEKTKEIINRFCAPHVHSWWIDTQDRAIREGSKIREELVEQIRNDIQAISDELSNYLGESLQVEINIGTIQFPSFEFKGIDAQIHHQQEVFQRSTRERRTKGRCCASDEVYYVDVPIEEQRNFYVIDLKDILTRIKVRLDEQARDNKILLQRVIYKQVEEDFNRAETQISDYINKFQMEFDKLLIQRVKFESDTPRVLASLKRDKESLQTYFKVIETIRASLATWKP